MGSYLILHVLERDLNKNWEYWGSCMKNSRQKSLPTLTEIRHNFNPENELATASGGGGLV